MNDITNVEHTHQAVIEPDNQPTVGIHVDRLTEDIHRARQFHADPSAERLQPRPVRRRNIVRERIKRHQDPLQQPCRGDRGVDIVHPGRSRRRPPDVHAEPDDDP